VPLVASDQRQILRHTTLSPSATMSRVVIRMSGMKVYIWRIICSSSATPTVLPPGQGVDAHHIRMAPTQQSGFWVSAVLPKNRPNPRHF
jgi:hypothetical protein